MCGLLCQNIVGIKLNKKRLAAIFICMQLFLTGYFLMLQPIEAAAAQKVSSLKQMEKFFKQSIKKGENTVTFMSSDSYTAAQIQNGLQSAAKSQSRLLDGSIQITRKMDSSGRYHYKIDLSDDALIKVKILKSKPAAVKWEMRSAVYDGLWDSAGWRPCMDIRKDWQQIPIY